MSGRTATVALPIEACPALGRPRRGRSWLRDTLLGLAGLAGLFLLWFLATDVLSPPASLAHRFSPAAAVGSLPSLVVDSDLLSHVAASLARVSTGLGLAIMTGVPLGLAVGSWRPLETGTTPVFQLLR